MSEMREKMPLGLDGHPDENQLLLALERELPAEEAAGIQRHLGSCWSCRARSHELQKGILAFVEYREKRYLPSLATPPGDFRDFRRNLRIVASEVQSAGILMRIWRRLVASLIPPSQFRWAAGVAVMTAIVVIWTQVLTPPVLSASELLTRAAAFQNPNQAPEKARKARRVRQRVRISDGRNPAVIRDFEWETGSKIAKARWELSSDPTKWNAPLTAAGFASWRDSAPATEDKVRRSGALWILDTTAASGAIKSAQIVMRANDYHPVEQHLRFADDRQLDFEELAFEISTQDQAVDVPQVSQKAAPQAAQPAPPAPVNLNEAELDLRYVLFTNRWDLDEDFQITRDASNVIVSGTASSAERAASMRSVLDRLPHVRASIAAPGEGQNTPAAAAPPTKTTPVASLPLLRETLDRSFNSSDERRAFIDRILNASDKALSHAWALKRLADRYSAEEEALLTAESKGRLKEILRAHLQQLDSANVELNPLIGLLPASPPHESGAASSWRAGVASLFTQVQQQDALVAALIVGTQANGQDLRSASQSLQTANFGIRSLLRVLESTEAAGALK